MNRAMILAITFVLMLNIYKSASAQTATPTESLFICQEAADTGTVVINFLTGLFGAGGVSLAQAAECESNTINPAELDSFFRQIREAADRINALPDEIKNAGPSGQTLTDTTAGIGQIAGYVKWLFSPNSAQELLGRSLAPIGTNILVIFVMTVAMVAIYISINIVVFTIKMIVWLVNQILKILPFW